MAFHSVQTIHLPAPVDEFRFSLALSKLMTAIAEFCIESAGTFEIRDAHSGELAPQTAVFADATMADRHARELGNNWRVFRKE